MREANHPCFSLLLLPSPLKKKLKINTNFLGPAGVDALGVPGRLQRSAGRRGGASVSFLGSLARRLSREFRFSGTPEGGGRERGAEHGLYKAEEPAGRTHVAARRQVSVALPGPRPSRQPGSERGVRAAGGGRPRRPGVWARGAGNNGKSRHGNDVVRWAQSTLASPPGCWGSWETDPKQPRQPAAFLQKLCTTEFLFLVLAFALCSHGWQCDTPRPARGAQWWRVDL